MLFMNRNRSIRVTHQYFNVSSSDKLSATYKVQTRNAVLVSNKEIIPIKFEINNLTIIGKAKGLLKNEKCEWTAIELFQLKANSLSFEYDINNTITNSKFKATLTDLCKNTLQLHVLIKTQDIKMIKAKYPLNLNILNKSNYSSLIDIIYNCKECNMNEMTDDLKLFPRNSKIKIINFYLIENSPFENINSEFWMAILELDNIRFKSRSGKLIKIIDIHDNYNEETLNNNSFKISIEGIEEIVSYQAL